MDEEVSENLNYKTAEIDLHTTYVDSFIKYNVISYLRV